METLLFFDMLNENSLPWHYILSIPRKFVGNLCKNEFNWRFWHGNCHFSPLFNKLVEFVKNRERHARSKFETYSALNSTRFLKRWIQVIKWYDWCSSVNFYQPLFYAYQIGSIAYIDVVSGNQSWISLRLYMSLERLGPYTTHTRMIFILQSYKVWVLYYS